MLKGMDLDHNGCIYHIWMFCTAGSTNIAAWKMDMYCMAGKWICLYTFKMYFHVFPIEDGDIPANYFSLPEGQRIYLFIELRKAGVNRMGIFKLVLENVFYT